MVEVPRGDKTIKLSIHFFAGDLPNSKMAWQQGSVSIVTNRSRGLRNTNEAREMFNSFDELPKKIQKVLEKNEIVLVRQKKDGPLEIITPNLA